MVFGLNTSKAIEKSIPSASYTVARLASISMINGTYMTKPSKKFLTLAVALLHDLKKLKFWHRRALTFFLS